VLVPALGRLRVPVSSVEAGRWDHSRHSESFAPAPQAAYPELRRQKNRQARERLASGLDVRADQGAVWNELAAKSERHDSRSSTGAMHDVFESRRSALADMAGAVRVREGQQGALVFIGGRFSVLDWVSRGDAFAYLHGPLVQGYALDALEGEEAAASALPTLEEAHRILECLGEARATESSAVGLGHDLRFADAGLAGAGLACEGELVQVTAFPPDSEAPGAQESRTARIRRPSRRRA
jgi:hypothetical protein